MSEAKQLFQNFIAIFQFFGFWPTEIKRPKGVKVVQFNVFVMFEILPLILMPLKLIQEPSTEEIIHTLMLTVNEDQLAIPYIDEACVKANKILKCMCMLGFMSVNVQVLLLPLIFGISPIPMYQTSWTLTGTGFGLMWIYQMFIYNYAAKSGSSMVLAFALVILATAYAKYLSSILQELSSSSFWMDEYKELIKCIRIHLRLRKMINDWKEIYGVIIGLMIKTCEIYVAASIFLSTHGEEKLATREALVFSVMVIAAVFYQFVPCYCGTNLLNITENFSFDLFSSDWTDGNLKYKKALIIFCENLKQPITLSIYGYRKISLEIFHKNMKSSYSMYQAFDKLNNIRKSKV